MSGLRSKRKGYRRERQIVQMHWAEGLEADRVPLSGAAGGNYAGDVVVASKSRKVAMQGEIKARANGEGFATLERWLGENDILFLVKDRTAPMVVLPWEMYAKLMGAA